ncbi:unnamed protein product [Aphanomyces euteiches]|uniref:Uncharacterized protein n=1 Tax=Aphanomyces euteiches TaxID=100861 RepID=A0A6G0XBA8_9STRA|nr:hypothetical protein Ae201684_006589 [Aphanomyces euteiches]KAH9090826.1 hypothetical protein Ae201684P_006230 [Aphanomyces euteiches]KAH9155612.1 hypothetical protein AeRB84_002419 [Aphanomyces euteiches]
MVLKSRRPMLSDNAPDAIDQLSNELHHGLDKAKTLERIWGVVRFDKASVATTTTTLLVVILDLRLASPDINYWIAAVLDAYTATVGFSIHDKPFKTAFLLMLTRIIKLPDSTGAFIDSKCKVASCVANLIEMAGAPAAEMILQESSLMAHLCDLVRQLHAQLGPLRALWRLVYYSPSARPVVRDVLATVDLDSFDKQVQGVLASMGPLLEPTPAPEVN